MGKGRLKKLIAAALAVSMAIGGIPLAGKEAKNVQAAETRVNVARGAEVTASLGCSRADLSGITDGNASEFVEYSFSTTNSAGYIQVDLGASYTTLSSVKLIRHSGNSRSYGPTIIALSADENFTNPTYIFNSNKIEEVDSTSKGFNANGTSFEWTEEELGIFDWTINGGDDEFYVEYGGREFAVPSNIEAQYVRVYTAGENYITDSNWPWGNSKNQHIIELEVYASDIVEVNVEIPQGYEGGTVTGDRFVTVGSAATFTALPDEGYRFLHWVTKDSEGNETIVSRDTGITTKNLASEDSGLTYYAKFQKKASGSKNVASQTVNPNVKISSSGTKSVHASFAPLDNLITGKSSNYVDYQFTDNSGAAGYIEIDLGAKYTNFDCVKLQRYYENEKMYGSTIIALSEDKDFTNPTIVFNSNQVGTDSDVLKGVNADGETYFDLPNSENLNSIDWRNNGTEARYKESDYKGGREFAVPFGTVAQYVRVYTAGKNHDSKSWDGLQQHVFKLEVYVQEVKATAGSQETQVGDLSKEGPVDFALDGNPSTAWHTQYSGSSEEKLQEYQRWIDFGFCTPTVINGLKVTSRNGNGNIYKYEVWVSDTTGPLNSLDGKTGDDYTSTWKKQFVKVCEGSWPFGCATEKTISFPAVSATHVRLVVKNDATDYVYISEMSCTKPDTLENETYFKGGSLRMDLPNDYDQTFLRFEYQFPKTLDNGMTIDESADKYWGWKYSVESAAAVSSAQVKQVALEKYANMVDGQVCSSNVVFKNIARTNYERSIWVQLVVNYKDSTTNDTLTLYAPVAERSVQVVATAIVDHYKDVSGKENQVKYANGILGKSSN